MSYNVKWGVDHVDQQSHSLTVIRRSYKWYRKIFIRMMMMRVLNAHKLYQLQGGRCDYLEFLHNVITLLLLNAPRIRNNPNASRDNILRLMGRHFSGQLLSSQQTDLDLKCAAFVMLGGRGNPKEESFRYMLFALTVLVNLACALEIVLEDFIPNLITLSKH